MKRTFPGATSYRDRHGRLRWRYRAKGRTVQLGAVAYGSPEFIAAYEAATKGTAKPERVAPGTLDALIARFYDSAGFRALSPSTRRVYRGWMERLRAGRGHKLVRDLRRRDVLAIVAKAADTPAAANNRLRALRMLMRLALDLEWRTDNPTLGVKRYRTGSLHTWAEAEIAAYFARHPAGTLAHTAMVLMLYTGAARADAVALGWGNVRDGRLTYRRQKMRTRDGVTISLPIHPELAAVLGALPRDAFTFLQTRQGKSRSPAGLGNLMRRWCDAADLPECSAHGLRKAVARRLAEAGATTRERMAVLGHLSPDESERYAEEADRAALADAGLARLGNGNVANHPARLAKRDD